MNDINSFENLRSKITFHYHALEKGMSNSDLRLGFGKNAFKGLFDSMELYKNLNYPLDDIRYTTAVSTIEQYIKLHNDNKYEVVEIEERYHNLIDSIPNEISDQGGFYSLNKEDILNHINSEFSTFSKNRFSVRDFSKEPVDLTILEEAIQIATKTPSVCNRQAWKVYIIKNQELLSKVLRYQGGLNGFGKNLETLLVVTCDNQYLGSYNERNQTYIDGGMFAMTLLYSLQTKGLASCPLNANLFNKTEENIRAQVGISYPEDIILFVAVGNYPDNFKVAKSQRDDYKMITEYRL